MKVGKQKKANGQTDPDTQSKDTIVIYGGQRCGNHYLQSYFESLGEKCEFRHEAPWAKKLYDEKGKQLIILVRNPRDQLVSNAYAIYNVEYELRIKAGPDHTELDPHEIPLQAVGQACKYLTDFTDTMATLVALYPYQFILYDTIAPKKLNSVYVKRDPGYYKRTITNYDDIMEMLDRSDVEEYCLDLWRAYNLKQTVFYPELANV